MNVFMGILMGFLILVVVALLALLVWIIVDAVSPPNLTEGEVYEKEFIPAHSQMMIIPIIISNGKTTTTIMMPYMYHYLDSWVIRIKDFQDEKWVTEDFYVSKDVYDAVTIGSEFKYEPNRGDLDDQPYTREEIEEDTES